MLPGDTKILCGDNYSKITDIREDQTVSGALGWSETGLTSIKDVYVNYDHKTPLMKFTTTTGAVLRCSPDQMCFGRLNPIMRQQTLYLHERSTMGFRIDLSNDLTHDLLAMNSIKNDFPSQNELKDRIWIIETASNFMAANFMLKHTIFKYGLPNIPFSAKHPDSELSEDMIRQIFNSIDTPARGYDLLNDWNMFLEHPHIVMRVSNRPTPVSSAIHFVLFGGIEKNKKLSYSHLIQISSSDDSNRAEHKQFNRKQGKHGVWFLEIARDDFEEAELFVKTLSHLDSLDIVKKIQLTRKAPFYILPASHVKSGMLVPILGKNGLIEEDTVTSIETEDYKGSLYNLQVRDLHNYIAGQWVVMCYNPPNQRSGD